MADSLHKQCVDATVVILRSLNLNGIDKIRTQLLEDESNLERPCLRVTIEGLPETLANLTSASRIVTYPVRVEVIGQVEPGNADRLAQWTLWREQIAAGFPDRRIPAYPAGVHGCEVLPQPAIEGDHHAVMQGAGSMILRFKAVRGVF